MGLKVFTRSMDEMLYNKMRSFIPKEIKCEAHTGYSEFTDAARFLHEMIERNDGVVLICDEDCFITDWNAVTEIAVKMWGGGYSFCGIPDGGVITHRAFSWVTANPFFVFFNCDVIKKEKAKLNRRIIDWHGYSPEIEIHKPDFVFGAFNHGNQEPFNGLFYWLAKWSTPLYINGTTMGDGIATEVLGLDNQTIAIHTWYSRDKGEANQMRIAHLYNYALSIKK